MVPPALVPTPTVPPGLRIEAQPSMRPRSCPICAQQVG